MADRVYITGNNARLITSKPGHNASPSLADDFKSFDSNWFYGGAIRWIGKVTVPHRNTGVYYTFPQPLNFIPAIVVIKTLPLKSYQGDNRPAAGICVSADANTRPLNNLQVTSQRVGPFPTDGAYTQFTYDAYVVVFEA
ncbi:hypothetical protein C5748_03810 [Phyllobacterium phragmitis]|uniref:Uncharacterized protein n=1 Tax=Phyllobacterium phragmitis TaxID=2670329 RepID=A0A2S9IXS8_9HYPH|nr:hypothetical protein [Phyllobacterium phragmitis]PRD45331.1 hypothetical protein C5748_03810 [Phyllobacterium phragmitis]